MFRRLLIPVDGSHASAAIVPYAGELATRLGCEVDVLLVEPASNPSMPHPEHHKPLPKRDGEAGAMMLGTSTPAYVREANERYVQRHVEELAALGVTAFGAVVCGDPVEEIMRAALDRRCDAIAMASRKLSNYSRNKTGSIAEEVLWRSKLPVLMVAQG
jgi:nucleotide-binding universal stress UspA family protein